MLDLTKFQDLSISNLTKEYNIINGEYRIETCLALEMNAQILVF